ncbi:uncharacterized protein LOC123506485 [Portunus trituberculatus]|uniref:uncharacterized protein LOC123506485 n=1 Tax=Portunus trituberculatus TaxID=210409 RepID=UPI001E1CBEE6|nr:uncharacterized protein LOC123506485 [Portunus trituberculatus]
MSRTRQHHHLLPLFLHLLLWLHVEGFQEVYYKRQFSGSRTFVGNFSSYTTSTIRCASLCSILECHAWSWDSAKGECLVYTYLEGTIQSAPSTCSSYLPLYTFIPLWAKGYNWSWLEAMIACKTIWATQAYVGHEERFALEKKLGSPYFVGLKKTSNNSWADTSGVIVPDPMWSTGYPMSEKCAMYNGGLKDVDCFDRFSLRTIVVREHSVSEYRLRRGSDE